MGIFTGLVALLLVPLGQALHYKVMAGVLHSSIHLTTHFDPFDVKDITWTLKIQDKEYRIVECRIQNGDLFATDGSRYKTYCNGTVLGIDNLTINDGGLYTADVTFLNDTMSEEGFNITVYEEVKTDHSTVPHKIFLVIPGLAVLLVLVVVWCGARNIGRSSNKPGDAS